MSSTERSELSDAKNPPPVCLIILDGFGEAPPGADNAVTLAEPKFLLDLREQWPLGFLDASGIEVGLPCGLMGNSEGRAPEHWCGSRGLPGDFAHR